MWQSMPGRRSGREWLDSMISLEHLRRSEIGMQPTTKVERVLGMKVSEIHVQREFRVESASIED